MNVAFSEYVQSHAFNLSLSRRMIHRLSALHTERRLSLEDSHAWSDDSGTNRHLLGRGLVVHHAWPTLTMLQEERRTWRRSTRVEQMWEVTPAGVLVLQLLVEAGLIARVDSARTRSKASA